MGLELLNQRNSPNEYLSKLLSKDELPILFRTFLNLYEVEYKMLNLHRVLLDDGEFEAIVNVEMFNEFKIGSENYTATIDMIFNYDVLVDEFENFKKGEDHWHDEGLMKIGLMFHGDVLLIGVSEDKRDEIWRYGNGVLETKCSKLDDNIFDFFSRLKQTIDPDKLEEFEISENKLYKKWGEDFWRVKE